MCGQVRHQESGWRGGWHLPVASGICCLELEDCVSHDFEMSLGPASASQGLLHRIGIRCVLGVVAEQRAEF